MAAFVGNIFALDVDGKPTIAFEAKNFHEASELRKEEWLRADLIALTSNGAPLCTPTATLKVRRADETETQAYREAELQAETEDLILAYLVDLDQAGPDAPADLR